MLAYYKTESIPNSGMSMPAPGSGMAASLETMNSVKSLVCSPDLTMFTSPRCNRVEAAQPSKPSTVVDGGGKYQCLLCQKTFAQKNVYQSHLRSHSKEGNDPYHCNICSKTFAVPARLTRHYRTHTGEKPYQCEYCKKSFSVKENLSVHRRIHTNERPYKCNVCERAFEHSGKLHRHMRIHTGERPHKCSICSKTFIQSGQLVIHMRTHTGEKPYVCDECQKGFTCSKQLKVHMRTHTGEKPYTCEICCKAFGYNHVLKLHQVSHYGEKVYKCTICNETFNSKKTMELHIKKHPESPTSLASTIPDSGTSSPSAPSVGSPVSPIKPDIKISQDDIGVPSGNGSAIVPTLLSLTIDDKENHMKTEETYSTASTYAVQRDLAYYLYSGNREQQYSQPGTTSPSEIVLGDIEEKRFQASVVVSAPLEPTTQHHVLFYPDPAYSSFGLTPNGGVDLDTADCSSLLNLPGNDARRRVEAALEAVEEERQRQEYDGIVKINRDPLLTPPSSNPESPASSPDLALDLAIPPRETLILPPRKRSKMILQSMESEYRSSGGLIATSQPSHPWGQRESSVIQYARASYNRVETHYILEEQVAYKSLSLHTGFETSSTVAMFRQFDKMGGGDLNLKKSWHPSTMKNMEKVRKAEQQNDQENRRIAELKRQIEMEKDHEDMTKYAMEQGVIEKKDDKKLDWMYKGPNQMVNREEYLLGRPVDKAFEQMQQAEKETEINKPPKNHVEYECIPPSLRFFSGNEQVDLIRKMQEDPLYAIKKKEMESRSQLLKNPVKLKQLKELLEQQTRKTKGERKKKKSKEKDSSEDEAELDKLLAIKFKQLKDNISEKDLLKSMKKIKNKRKKKSRKHSSESESNSSSDDASAKKRRHKRKKKRKKSTSDSDSDSDSTDSTSNENVTQHEKKERNKKKYDKKRSSDDVKVDNDDKQTRKRKSSKHRNLKKKRKNSSSDSDSDSDTESTDNENIIEHKKKDNKKEYDKRRSSDDIKVDNDDKRIRKRKLSKHRDFKYERNRKHEKEYDTNYNKRRYEQSDMRRDSSKDRYRRKYSAERRNDKTELNDKRSTFDISRMNFKEDRKELKYRPKARPSLTEEEKEQRRQEMMANAAWRDKEREKNVKMYREEEKIEIQSSSYNKDFIRKQLVVATEMGTVASRIKANINNIQRSGRAMDMNFAKR
ncbi:uncharacterized protein LOC114938777 [Nylanderia fulva]|uniref:uncharacterized protein LOC114938777 n=1 Tax=Nylanderia fulva TaxID=613905 RepID=UPI0010FB3C58|nr:uncharacterized protein LOC114938777 [Nylanderia fulva]